MRRIDLGKSLCLSRLMHNPWQPLLSGKLIQLRPLEEKDWDELFACAADPKIWEQHPASDRYQQAVFRKFFSDALLAKGAFVVVDSARNVIIGSSRYYDHFPEKKCISIGYTFLACAYWGGKFNRELKQLMLEHAFNFVDTVHFEIGANNLRSQRAIVKIGAQLTGSNIRENDRHLLYSIDKWNYSGRILG